MNNDLTIYEVSVTFQSKMGNLSAACTISEKVEGREQLEMVLAWLRNKGLEPMWQVYHAKGAADTIKIFNNRMADFPMVPNILNKEEA